MSREIEILVAEKVMGWTYTRPANRYDLRSPGSLRPDFMLDYQIDFVDGPKPDVFVDTSMVPAYLTDPAADYSVLVRVRETWSDDPEQKRFRVAFAKITEDRRAAKAGQWRASGSGMFMFYEPGDYSRAALAALGVEGGRQ